MVYAIMLIGIVSKNYVLIDDSNEENILLTPKGKQDYMKI
jgi:hypothetical protein